MLFLAKHHSFQLIGGGLCAALVGWLGAAVLAFGCGRLFDWLEPLSMSRTSGFNSDPLVAGLVISSVVGLFSLPIIGYAMGFICAFFWHALPAKPGDSLIGPAMLVLLIVQLPLWFSLGLAIVPALIAVCPLLIFPMRRGLETGLIWWSHDGVGHFFGLRNNWEREANEG